MEASLGSVRRLFGILVLGTLLAPITAVAENQVQEALTRLMSMEIVESSRIGSAAARSQSSKDLDLILAQPNRKELLESLARSDSPYAKVYALAGLRVVGDSEFEALKRELMNQPTIEMTVQIGCVGEVYNLSLVVELVEVGLYEPTTE